MKLFRRNPDKMDARLRRSPFWRWQVKVFPILGEWETNAVVNLVLTRAWQLNHRGGGRLHIPALLGFGRSAPESLKGEIIRIRIMCALLMIVSCGFFYPSAVMVAMTLSMANGGKPTRIGADTGGIFSISGFQREALTEIWQAGIGGRDLLVGNLLLACAWLQRTVRGFSGVTLAALPFAFWFGYRQFVAYRIRNGGMPFVSVSAADLSWSMGALEMLWGLSLLVIAVGLIYCLFLLLLPWLMLSLFPFAWAVRELWKPGTLIENALRFFLKVVPDGFVMFLIGVVGTIITMITLTLVFEGDWLLMPSSELPLALFYLCLILLGAWVILFAITAVVVPLVQWRLVHWYGPELDRRFEYFVRRVVMEDPDWARELECSGSG